MAEGGLRIRPDERMTRRGGIWRVGSGRCAVIGPMLAAGPTGGGGPVGKGEGAVGEDLEGLAALGGEQDGGAGGGGGQGDLDRTAAVGLNPDPPGAAESRQQF